MERIACQKQKYKYILEKNLAKSKILIKKVGEGGGIMSTLQKSAGKHGREKFHRV